MLIYLFSSGLLAYYLIIALLFAVSSIINFANSFINYPSPPAIFYRSFVIAIPEYFFLGLYFFY